MNKKSGFNHHVVLFFRLKPEKQNTFSNIESIQQYQK